jgi:hypothetical protein
MKTLADIKRRYATKEPVVMTWHNYQPERVGTVFVPEKIQGNAIMFEGKYWHYYRKAAQYRIDGPDSFTVLGDDMAPLVSYRFIKQERNSR